MGVRRARVEGRRVGRGGEGDGITPGFSCSYSGQSAASAEAAAPTDVNGGKRRPGAPRRSVQAHQKGKPSLRSYVGLCDRCQDLQACEINPSDRLNEWGAHSPKLCKPARKVCVTKQ